ncbi:VOC family protein [Streptomyces sp. NBC_00690]|uniref:VOC family protein n=1 Tax=Streptomyces sp. NBC_00690 TaxID=2975808 RepID=UPI002E27BC91|nr:VOC family protein [Streptomyces sp. NBC_00690]
MTATPCVIRAIVIDCADPERLASFWSRLLGSPVEERLGPYIWLAHCGSTQVGFQKVAEPKSAKNRVHLDLASPDSAAEQNRIEALGGRQLHEYEIGGFLVMADSEGNEFCVIPDGSVELDEQGHAHYLGDRSAGRQV